MPAPTNEDVFNAVTLSIFNKLRSEFPSPTSIDTSAIAVSLFADEIVGETGQRILGASEHAMTWLVEEGFITIRGQSMDLGDFDGARLTSRGLAILNSTPGVVAGEATIGKQVSDFIESTAKDAARDAMKEGAPKLIGYIMRAAAVLFGGG